jgi:hypothetical protein
MDVFMVRILCFTFRLENFMECCKSIPELGVHMENGINVDPKPLSMEEFAVAGVPVNGQVRVAIDNIRL